MVGASGSSREHVLPKVIDAVESQLIGDTAASGEVRMEIGDSMATSWESSGTKIRE